MRAKDFELDATMPSEKWLSDFSHLNDTNLIESLKIAELLSNVEFEQEYPFEVIDVHKSTSLDDTQGGSKLVSLFYPDVFKVGQKKRDEFKCS